MKDRILIWNDKNAGNAFEKEVQSTAERCNSLIEAFESFLEGQKISTYQEWIDLCTSPEDYFDKILLASVDLKISGNKKPSPDALSKLVQVDRENYLNIVAGKPIAEGCKPCQKMKIRKGSTAISLSSYKQYQDYLIFNSGNFTINEEIITKKKEDFKIFAETEKQLKYYSHFVDLAKILNEHIELNKLGNTQIDQLKSMTGLLLLDNKLILNDMKLAETIKYL
jgi:hypothetical protein